MTITLVFLLSLIVAVRFVLLAYFYGGDGWLAVLASVVAVGMAELLMIKNRR